jgi:hypothetical protein
MNITVQMIDTSLGVLLLTVALMAIGLLVYLWRRA